MRTGFSCSFLDLFDGRCEVGVQPVRGVRAEIVQAPLSLMGTQCNVLLKRALENFRIDALVREVVCVSGSFYAISTRSFLFGLLERLEVSCGEMGGLVSVAVHCIYCRS